jgi:hypothetical protein
MNRGILARNCALVLIAVGLSGCAAPLVAGLTLSQISTIAGVISTAFTGKGLSDHLLSFVTGKDCDLTESILRKDRKLCEEKGSAATAEDFKGIFVAFGGKKTDPLDRYAMARQKELADATVQQSDQSADAVLFTVAMRTGIPKKGEPVGPSQLGNEIVYLMPPIYDDSSSAVPVPKPSPLITAQIPVPQPSPLVATNVAANTIALAKPRD